MKSTEHLISELSCGDRRYRYYDLSKLDATNIDRLPKSLKILLENHSSLRAQQAMNWLSLRTRPNCWG